MRVGVRSGRRKLNRLPPRPDPGGAYLTVQIDWSEYSRVHTRRSNLLIHLFAVPLFVGSFVFLLIYIANDDRFSALIVLGLAVVAMALQGREHKLEKEPPRPFSGPANFLRRWFTEQFFIFPAFVVTGRWWQQYRASGKLDLSEP